MCVNLQNMYETALFSGKIYTADKNITRPPVATVATNSKSAAVMVIGIDSTENLVMRTCGFCFMIKIE